MNPTDPPIEPSPTCCPAGNCGEIPRRDFVRALTLGAAAAAVPALPVMAGPFETTIQEAAEQEASEQRELVPADKKLDPQWVKSLFERGTREVYRGKDLEKIGMPIGGLCAGQLYLGGDGKLWHWDIFNKIQGTGDHNYAFPPLPSSPLEQGFAIEIATGPDKASPNKTGPEKQLRALDRLRASPDITFCGEYPIAYIEYRDPKSPVSVSLEAFSPHIPLNVQASSLPATLSATRSRTRVVARSNPIGRLAGKRRRALHLARRQGQAAESRSCGSRGCWPSIAKSRSTTSMNSGTLTLALLEPVESDRATPALAKGPFPAAAFVSDPQPQAPQPAGGADRLDHPQADLGTRPRSDGDLCHRLAFPAAEA